MVNVFPDNKPVEHFVLFTELMAQVSEKKVFKNNAVVYDFTTTPSCVCFLESGRVGLYRKSDRLLVYTNTAPVALGFAHMGGTADLLIRAQSEVICYLVPSQTVAQIIEDKNLWKEVATMMSWAIKNYTRRDTGLVGTDAYTTIRHHLMLLIKLPAEERLAISAEKFIVERTFLSRSRVLSILRELVAGEYITIKRGILMEIKNIPQAF